MHPFDELCSYVGFCDEDASVLTTFGPRLDRDIAGAVNAFYDAIDAHPGAQRILVDTAQRKRLERSLTGWIEELFTGPFDHDYHAHRLSIGRVHVRVRLPQQYMFTAMNVLRRELCAAADRQRADADTTRAFVAALHKILDIELAIMLGTYMEYEQRRKLESFRDLIIGTLPIAVILLDENDCIAALTTPIKAVLRPEARVGSTIAEAFTPDFLAASALEKRLAKARELGHQLLLPRITVEDPRGTYHLRATIVPVEHDVARMLLHIEDLTDALESEARMQQQQHLAELGAMSAAVAHEIRNPLTGIATTVQVIADGLEEGDGRKSILGKVYAQTHRLSDQLTELLRFSRPADVHPRAVELSAVADTARETLPDEQRKDVRITGSGEAVADPDVLSRGLLNLYKNAFEAGATTVTVDVTPGTLIVRDNGPGIPEVTRAKIFRPFFTTKTRGTGLGLAITHRAISAMDGQLVLLDSDGGSVFQVTVPKGQPPIDGS